MKKEIGMNMNKKINSILINITLLLFVLSQFSLAQYIIENSVWGNGGGFSYNSLFGMESLVGQSLIGISENTNNTAQLGFWYTIRTYTDISDIDNQLPQKFELLQNFPNPFNPSTQIKYAIPKSSHVRIEVYNVLGQRITTLVNENKPAGFYTVEFNAGSLASGFYIYLLRAENFVQTRKMLVTK